MKGPYTTTYRTVPGVPFSSRWLGALCRRVSLAALWLAALGGVRAAWATDGFKPLTTPVIRGGQAPVRISVPIKGLTNLWLLATSGDDDYHHDRAAWGDPVLIDADGNRVDLTRIKPASAKTGWGHLLIDSDLTGTQPLTIGTVTFKHGLFAHAPSALHYVLDGSYERFEASVGIGAGAGQNGSSEFRVLAAYSNTRMQPYPKGHPVEAPDPVNVNPDALRRAINDLTATFPATYPKGREYLARLETLLKQEDGADRTAALKALQREALLANPLLDFNRVLIIRRKASNVGLPRNWCSNSSLPKTGYNNDIAILRLDELDKEPATAFRPAADVFVGDVDLHFNADRLLFSMPSDGGRGAWHVHELAIDSATGMRAGSNDLRRVSQTTEPGVNNYDACYLPDGRILFTSTAAMAAVPCVRGSAPVATLYRMNADGSGMRQLTFDQEHSWNPVVMNNGRVLYARWEYADLPHSNSRMLFTMNPDGTNQRSYYGSNSFWPNSIFYARPIPGHPTRVVATITGHHAPPRMGELYLFDPALGTCEAEGAVQQIPGYGKKVEPVIQDGLTGGSWPKFLHPYPLGDPDTGRGSGKYFLVSACPRGGAWGIYLVDVFDNMLLLKEQNGFALMEPVPLKPCPTPPIIPDKIDLSRKDAVVLISNVYEGPGLAGIPVGEVKRLRVFSYTFGYPGVGGLYGSIGMDGPWDMRRTLGTVPIEADGSAMFRAPANTPIAVQPLDAEGKALQLMRSWFTAMPGETLSCIGCHEAANTAPPATHPLAARRAPRELEPWHGPPRNYEFAREMQPVLDRFCVGCHGGDGSATGADPVPHGMVRYDGRLIPDLRGSVPLEGWTTRMAGNTGKGTGGKFSVAYANLHRFVRHPGIESPMPLQMPMEFHADTTELVQMLLKGHHNVRLDNEGWDRLVTWIDFNAPYHGRWSTIVGDSARGKEDQRARLRLLYANVDENHEDEPLPAPAAVAPLMAAPEETPPPAETAAGVTVVNPWTPATRTIDLGEGIALELVRVPAGEFTMGSVTGYRDEWPVTRVRVEKGFWIGRFEVTNEQFRRFDPRHDSREEDRHGYQFGIPGYTVNDPRMPAVRLSWRQAVAFCEWLTGIAGQAVTLPTEAQWEWACRAGTESPFWFGDFDTDFSTCANMGDASLADFSGNPYVLDHVRARYNNPGNEFDNWVPQDARFNDGGFVSEDVGRYKPNAWGLHDMHGNVAEWTLSLYRPYPYDDADGRNDADAPGKRVVRGGSWYDRPKRCTASYRFGYRPYQGVYNVGLRVVMAE